MTIMKSLKELGDGARVTGPLWNSRAVEARFIHWVETLRKLPDRETRWLYGSRTYWPKISGGPSELFSEAGDSERKYEAPPPHAAAGKLRRYSAL